MVFTSWAFVVFFLGFLLVLSLMPNRWTRQLAILAGSICFYGYWNKWYLLLLLTPSVIDYVCALRIAESTNAGVRRLWLWVSVVSNLGLLGYFKYANFFLESAAHLSGRPFVRLDILLPIGISFYTFKTMSYTIDVYRGEISVCRDWWRYAMFVTYFPELIAGPIVRASVFLPQMARSLRPSWARSRVGLQLILLGVTKKLLIADRLAVLSDAVYAHAKVFAPATVISGIVAYSLQIYCDFSGYSDIAIGVSRVIGFDLPENFNMPYLATSVTEFWRRWHITLSQWLRDYLYIPLGGNRKGELRTYLNLMITMLLGGLWHGASWTFVVWGALHGMGLAVHKLWTRNGAPPVRIPKAVAWLMTYGFVCVGWVFFRSPDFSTAMLILRKALWIDRLGVNYVFLPLYLSVVAAVAAHLAGVYGARLLKRRKRGSRPGWLARIYAGNGGRVAMQPHQRAGIYILLPLPGFVGGAVLTLWLLVVYLFAMVHSNPFIYFQF